jgi:peptidoglycan/LPS O-acetylase OafA/YrhL
MSEKPSGARLEALDGLRGVAALGVVFWHFQHFGGDAGAYPYRTFPLTGWAYERGWILVDFFFLLSGCVFTHKYLSPVAAGRIRAREFFVLRVSRIYPLHLATLLVVAGIQWWRVGHHEPTLLYQNNDLYHFALNLVFLQAGWFEQGYQYNNPSWSVAVEVLVYLLFFWIASRAGRYVAWAFGLTLLGLGVYKLGWTYPLFNELIARAVSGFFLGSLLFLGLRALRKAGLAQPFGIAAALALAGIAFMAHLIGYDAFIGGSGFRIIPQHVLVIFPLILTMTLLLDPVGRMLSIRPLTFLGDISFTVYLVHVPLQMVMLSIYELRGTKPATSDPRFFWTFFALLLVVATLIHRFMEVPLRGRIRRRFMAARPAAVVREDPVQEV